MKRGKKIGKRSLPAEKKKGSKKLRQRTPSPQPLSTSSSSSSSESSSDEEEEVQNTGNCDASMPIVWTPSENADIGDNDVTYSYGEASQGGSSGNLLEEAINSINLPVKHGNDVSVAPENVNNVVPTASCSNINSSKPPKKQSASSSSSSKDKPLKLKALRSYPSPPTFNQLNKSLLYNLIKYPIPMEDSTCHHLSNFIEIQMSQLNSYIKGEQDRIMSEFSSQVNLLNNVLIHNYTGGKQLRIKRGTDNNLYKKLLDFSKSLKDK